MRGEPVPTDLLEKHTGPCGLVAARHGQMLFFRNDAVIGRSIRTYGEWCEQEIELLYPACRPGDTIVDAGANLGTHAMALARRVGPSGAVHAFEPQASVAHLLGANAEMNGLTQIRVHAVALGDTEDVAAMPRIDPGTAQNIGGLALEPAAGADPVAVKRLDDVLDPPGLRLMKIDVEGMEASVIRGAAGLIQRFHPLLYVENDRIERSDALIDLIEALGYRLFWHIVPLFNPGNFAGATENLFPGIVSCSMVGVHEADAVEGPPLAPVVRGSHPIASLS